MGTHVAIGRTTSEVERFNKELQPAFPTIKMTQSKHNTLLVMLELTPQSGPFKNKKLCFDVNVPAGYPHEAPTVNTKQVNSNLDNQ